MTYTKPEIAEAGDAEDIIQSCLFGLFDNHAGGRGCASVADDLQD